MGEQEAQETVGWEEDDFHDVSWGNGPSVAAGHAASVVRACQVCMSVEKQVRTVLGHLQRGPQDVLQLYNFT